MYHRSSSEFSNHHSSPTNLAIHSLNITSIQTKLIDYQAETMKTATSLLIGVYLVILVAAAPVPIPEISSTCTSQGFCWNLVTYKNGACVKEKECSFQSSCQCNMSNVNLTNDENGPQDGQADVKEKDHKATGNDVNDSIHD